MASRGLTGFGLMVILAVAGLGASPVAQADRDEESYQYGVSLAQGRAIASMSTGDNVEELCRGWLGMMFQYIDEDLHFGDALQGCMDALPDPPTILNPQGVYPVSVDDLNVLICNDLGVNGVSVESVENIYHVLYEEPYRFTGVEAGRAVARAVHELCTSHIPAMDTAVEQATS